MKAATQSIYHQENKIKKSSSTFIGSALVIMSAVLPCLDRILVWTFPNLDIWTDSRGVLLSTNIWIASVYLSPVFIITSFFFQTNKKIYFFPLFIFFYSAIVYYAPIFNYHIKFLAFNSWLALIVSIVAAFLFIWLFGILKWIKLEEISNDDMLNDMKFEYDKLREENRQLKTKLNEITKN